MEKIRIGTFETNSSSVHTLTICDLDTYNKWKNGELVYDEYGDKFIAVDYVLSTDQRSFAREKYLSDMKCYWKTWDNLTENEKNEWYKKYAIDTNLIPENAKTYDDFFEDFYYEEYEKHYTTKNGDKIVCFGKYGNN